MKDDDKTIEENTNSVNEEASTDENVDTPADGEQTDEGTSEENEGTEVADGEQGEVQGDQPTDEKKEEKDLLERANKLGIGIKEGTKLKNLRKIVTKAEAKAEKEAKKAEEKDAKAKVETKEDVINIAISDIGDEPKEGDVDAYFEAIEGDVDEDIIIAVKKHFGFIEKSEETDAENSDEEKEEVLKAGSQKPEADSKVDDIPADAPDEEEGNIEDFTMSVDAKMKVLNEANNYVEDPMKVIAPYQAILESKGVWDDVQIGGVTEMFKYIRPKKVLSMVVANVKSKAKFR
jgi:hypothetical protein